MEIALILIVVAGAVLYLMKRFRRSLSGSCGCSCADCPGAKKPSKCQTCVDLTNLQKLHADNLQCENLQSKDVPCEKVPCANTQQDGESSMCAKLNVCKTHKH